MAQAQRGPEWASGMAETISQEGRHGARNLARNPHSELLAVHRENSQQTPSTWTPSPSRPIPSPQKPPMKPKLETIQLGARVAVSPIRLRALAFVPSPAGAQLTLATRG